MREARGIALRWIGSAVMVFSAWCSAVPASAQTTTDDAAARKHFEQGRAAFEETDWEQALLHFRDAYRLSHRPQLQYNIGVTADRLQRDEEALQAFESYLEAFRYGMPPHGGFAIGSERLLMQLLGLSNLRLSTLFPRDLGRVSP